MDEKKFMISKMNYILIAIALGVIVLGFLLMTGEPSGEIQPGYFQYPTHCSGTNDCIRRFYFYDCRHSVQTQK